MKRKFVFVHFLPSSGVLKLDLTSSSSSLLPTGLSVHPAGLHALTVTMYWVDGVRPVITPEEEWKSSEVKSVDKERYL